MLTQLREVTIQDAKLLFHLLKERPGYSNISHTKLPTFNNHLKFIQSKPYHKWYIVMGKGLGNYRQVGSAYITDRDEIGIHVLRKFWSQGYAKSAVKDVMRENPRKQYYANIAPSNMISQKLFKKLGFRTLQYTLIKD